MGEHRASGVPWGEGTGEDNQCPAYAESVGAPPLSFQLRALFIGDRLNIERLFHDPNVPLRPLLHKFFCGNARGTG